MQEAICLSTEMQACQNGMLPIHRTRAEFRHLASVNSHATLKTQDGMQRSYFLKVGKMEDFIYVGLQDHYNEECSFVLFLVGSREVGGKVPRIMAVLFLRNYLENTG